MESKRNHYLIETRSLSKAFTSKMSVLDWITREQAKHLKALDRVSLGIKKNETLGLVGESGCGKTTFGRCLLRLYEPTSGEILFEGNDILKYDKNRIKYFYSKMQMIFQDPYSSLNPRMTVRQTLSEVLKVHNVCKRKGEREDKIEDLLNKVGLSKRFKNQYPYAFSGGQRQRISIARALAANPTFIVADEPISALDVSIQAQILNLLIDLKEEMNLTFLFIAHDLNVVRHISHRIAVMYLGRIVEIATSKTLFSDPLHPYTRALLSAIPKPDPRKKTMTIAIEGDPPSPYNLPNGCSFHPRCHYAMDICREQEPKLSEVQTDHFVECFKYSV